MIEYAITMSVTQFAEQRPDDDGKLVRLVIDGQDLIYDGDWLVGGTIDQIAYTTPADWPFESVTHIWQTGGLSVDEIQSMLDIDLGYSYDYDDAAVESLGNLFPHTSSNDPVNLIAGTDGSDRLRGTNDHDSISGLADDDRLKGKDGNDLLVGNAGDDQLKGGNGDDRLFGGEVPDAPPSYDDDYGYGDDYGYRVSNKHAGDTVAKSGDAQTASDEDFPSDDDDLRGGAGNDWLMSDSGHDELRGGTGDDLLFMLEGYGNDEDRSVEMRGDNGADMFAFSEWAHGTLLVRDIDFAEGDRIALNLNQYDDIDAYSYLMENSVQDGDDVVFTGAQLTVTFRNLDMADITRDMVTHISDSDLF
jgi:Ca2+-binding RTX toxin-like protein